jgi:epoxyqueuosine reductase
MRRLPLCIDTCPTGAIVEGANERPALHSFLTQTKAFCRRIPEKSATAFMAATHAKPCARKTSESQSDSSLNSILTGNRQAVLEPLLTISNREFKEKFGHIQVHAAREKADSAQCHFSAGALKEVSAVPVLIELMTSMRARSSGTAAWALGRIGTDGSLEALKAAQETEKDEEVSRKSPKVWPFFRQI